MALMLLGLGADADATASAYDQDIASLLLKSPTPTSSDVADFLKPYAGAERTAAAQALIAHGVSPQAVAAALTWLDTSAQWPKSAIMGALALASAAASGYHGYKRNHSIGWAIVWFGLGAVFPIFVPVVAVAQGFGKRKAA